MTEKLRPGLQKAACDPARARPTHMLTLNICDVDLVQPLTEVQWHLVCSIAAEVGALTPHGAAHLTPLQTAAILRRVGAVAPLYSLPSMRVAPHEEMAAVIERSATPS